MGGTQVQKNKAHKTRFSSKGQRNKHTVAGRPNLPSGGQPSNPTAGNARGAARLQRLQRSRALRNQRKAEFMTKKRAEGSSEVAPRIVVFVGLASGVDIQALCNCVLEEAGGNTTSEVAAKPSPGHDEAMEDVAEAAPEASPMAATVQAPEGAMLGVSGGVTVPVRRHRVRMTVIAAPRTVQGCMEAGKVADVIVCVVPATLGTDHVDPCGRRLLTVLRAQGLPTIVGVIQGLAAVAPKRRSEAKKAAVAALQSVLGDDVRTHPFDSHTDAAQVIRHLSELRVGGPAWRGQRPYIVAERVAFTGSGEGEPSGGGMGGSQDAVAMWQADERHKGGGVLRVTGWLRARALTAGQLVHVTGVGDCQLARIDGPDDPCPLNPRGRRPQQGESDGSSMVDGGEGVTKVLAEIRGEQDLEPLVVENEVDAMAGEQTWPTENELAAADAERMQRVDAQEKKKKKVPAGTSEYQAAWIVDDDEDDEADDAKEGDDSRLGVSGGYDEGMLEVDDERRHAAGGVAVEAEVVEKMAEEDSSDWGDGEEEGPMSGWTSEVWPGDHSDMMADDANMTAADRERERLRLKALAKSDQEFPDEVDTPLDVPARQRFAKYRGLKSFRSSPWDPKESLPPEYARIFAFDNFRRTAKHVLEKQAEADATSLVSPGTFVELHILVSPDKAAAAAELANRPVSTVAPMLLVVCGLLHHESKLSVLHFTVRKSDTYTEPIKSKDELIFDTGFRTSKVRPIFSVDDPQLDKHKFERFLHPGQFVVASAYAPISFPPLPLLVFKRFGLGTEGAVESASAEGGVPDGTLELVATGSLKEVNPDGIILKKIVLTGYPLRVHKRRAVVRYMFHNPEDVRFFRPLEIYTKYGRRGRIKEPVGIHGTMKCIFDGVVQQRDTICVSLYKRMFPEWQA